MAIDFEIGTRVMLEMPKVANLGQQARAFYASASAVSQYVEQLPWPLGLHSDCGQFETPLWPRCAGLAWRPTLLHPFEMDRFFEVAGGAIYASGADFFRQEPPLLTNGSEAEWDAKV